MVGLIVGRRKKKIGNDALREVLLTTKSRGEGSRIEAGVGSNREAGEGGSRRCSSLRATREGVESNLLSICEEEGENLSV